MSSVSSLVSEPSSGALGDLLRRPLRRRTLLRSAALTGAGLALAATLPPRLALAAGTAQALLLNCIDYRLTDSVTAYMQARGLARNYDQVVLAGAALGAVH